MAENFFAITDTGKERSNNEDAFIAQKTPKGDAIIACVIDGVGGYTGGEIAAAIACEAIIEMLSKSVNDLPADLAAAFKTANDNIYAEKQQVKQHDSMACVATLALVDINRNQFHYAHVGDTRLYLLRDNSLVKISSDHSFVGFLEDSGRLTENAAMNHPKRNEINKALGFESEIVSKEGYIETGQSPFLPGDMLLICSDGLTDMVNKEEMTAILTASGSLAEKGKKLIDAANRNGGRDNITVALVQNDKPAIKQQAVMPATDVKKRLSEVKDQAPERPDPLVKRPDPMVNEPNKTHTITTINNNRGLLGLLAVLCVLFLAAAIWEYMQNNGTKQTQVVVPVKDTAAKPPVIGAMQSKLQAIINKASKKDTLFLADTAFQSPLILTEPIHIDNDTLFIKGKGNLILKADSAFTVTAFSLSTKCKYIIISNITLQNFATGVMCYNNSIMLKHVKFVNCKMPVQTFFTVPDSKYVNGKIASDVFKTDSLAKKPKK